MKLPSIIITASNLSKAKKLKSIEKALENSQNQEEIEALKSHRKMLFIGIPVILIPTILWCVSLFLGMCYKDILIPDNMEPVYMWINSDGTLHTSNKSLKGKTLEELELDKNGYNLTGDTFEIYFDDDTNEVFSFTREEEERISFVQSFCVIYGTLIYLIVLILTIIILRNATGKKWLNYSKKYYTE